MGFKVSGKVKHCITVEQDGQEHKLTHVFKSKTLDKCILSTMTQMMSSGIIDGSGEAHPAAGLEALQPFVGVYDQAISMVEGYEIEDEDDRLHPTECVPIGHKIQVITEILPKRMGTLESKQKN